MNNRRNAARRLEEEITNAEAPPRGDQFPRLKDEDNVEQAPVNL